MEEKFLYLTFRNILSPCCEDEIYPAYWSKITGEDGGEMLGKSKVSRWSQTCWNWDEAKIRNAEVGLEPQLGGWVLTALGVVVLLTSEDSCPYEVHTNSLRHAHSASNILPLQHGVGWAQVTQSLFLEVSWCEVTGIKGDGSVCSQLFSSVDRKDGRHSSECRRITHNAWRKSTLLGP